jgi:membrane-associated phospholipid phosphatase
VPGSAPILPRSLRRPAVVVASAATVAFLALAVRYYGRGVAGRTDGFAEGVLDGVADGRRGLFRLVVDIGDPLPVVLITALVAGIALALRRRRHAILVVAATGLTGVATTVLKPVVGRTINGSLAFPSGHTAAATALGLVVALLVVSLVDAGDRTAAVLTVTGAVVAGTGMGVALVAADIHYTTDTIGGFCVAVAVVIASALLIERVADQRVGPGSAP